MRVTWAQPEDLVRHELWQSAAEGRDVSAIEERWRVAGGVVGPPSAGASAEHGSVELVRLARELLAELDALPEVGAEDEPSDWAEIKRSSEALRRTRGHGMIARGVRAERVRGAWVGRAVGCVLGKPVEKIPRRGIEEILRSTRRWPLDRWFTAVGLDPAVSARWPWNKASRTTSLEENLAGTPEDDDLNYTLLALKIIETYGLDFTPDDVAQTWLLDLPAGRTFTAERVAYRNLLDGIGPPQTARVANPFREWIGAQIRTDLYGWVSPGDPWRAAELAYRDAAVSHTRNGIYGALFTAALASAALVSDDIGTVLDAGTAVVPPRSRMAAAIRFGRSLAEAEPATAYESLEQEFAGMHWVHALNNTALLSYALAAGRGDFDTTICLTVMGGWDTDSNGATAGAVAGALAGAGAIAERWTRPLQNRLSTSIPGFDGLTFDEVTGRTLALMPHG